MKGPRTRWPWVYKVGLEREATTTELRIMGFSAQEVLDKLARTKYRNWNVDKLERLTWVSPLQEFRGKPKTRIIEAYS